jgi:hypothetical protein
MLHRRTTYLFAKAAPVVERTALSLYRRSTAPSRCIGNGRKPTSAPPPGCWSVAPLWPQAVHRAHRRGLSLDVLGPQRISACDRRRVPALSQSQGVARCGSPRVEVVLAGFMADGEDVETLNLAHGQMGDKRRLDLPDDDPNPSNEEGAYLSSVLTGNDANWLEIN